MKIEKLQIQVDDFNRRCEVGTLVEYRPIKGSDKHVVTKTRSSASVLGGHTAVVWIEDIRGCVSLDFVEVIKNV